MLAQVAGTDGGPANPPGSIIHPERRWFDISDGNGIDLPGPRISASRWIGNAAERNEQQSEIEPDCHVIGIALQPTADVTVFANGKLVQTGHLPRGGMRVNEPGLPMRGIFRGAYDVLHLHVPNTMIAEYAYEKFGHARAATLITDRPVVDPMIERLGLALVHAEKLGGAYGHSYADGIGLAITAQLFGGNSDAGSTQRPRVSGLSKWRLKRATEFMAANIAEPINLADIAAAAGLSRMHFAAQFRISSGLRPHEYLLQRRIERAKELLTTTRQPLVEIAFDAGFKTQAHFTTVFARFVGATPNVWRRSQGASNMSIQEAA
jgi:AraC family transcriptional regulator